MDVVDKSSVNSPSERSDTGEGRLESRGKPPLASARVGTGGPAPLGPPVLVFGAQDAAAAAATAAGAAVWMP